MTPTPLQRTAMISSWAAVLGGAGLLAGCAHTNPEAGADITYYLPKTNVAAVVTLTLTACDPIGADAEVSIAAKAGRQETPYHLDSAQLASARIQRELHIVTGENLVLSGINAQATDQTTSIISSSLKLLTVAAAAPADLSPGGLGVCTPDAFYALRRVPVLKARITELRERLTQPYPADPTTRPSRDGRGAMAAETMGARERRSRGQEFADSRELNARIKELAALQTGILQVTTAQPLVLPSKSSAQAWSGQVALKADDFKTWFAKPETPAAELGQKLGLTWTATRVDMANLQVVPKTSGAGRSRSCGMSLPVPVASDVVFTVHAPTRSAAQSAAETEVVAQETFPVAQINDAAKLCIDVGFGEKRGVDVAFDKFGRATSLVWTSEATAANVAGALAGYAPDIKALTARGPAAASATDQQKAEIDRLKTLQDYNTLKACAAVLEAGGYDCNPPATNE